MNDKLQGEVGEFFILDEAKDAPSLLNIVKKANKKPTVFETITTSTEVLAEKLVFLKAVIYSLNAKDNTNYVEQWISTVCNDVYPSKHEAIAATVAKLKEVCDA